MSLSHPLQSGDADHGLRVLAVLGGRAVAGAALGPRPAGAAHHERGRHEPRRVQRRRHEPHSDDTGPRRHRAQPGRELLPPVERVREEVRGDIQVRAHTSEDGEKLILQSSTVITGS